MPVFTNYTVYNHDLERSVVMVTNVAYEGLVVAVKCEEQRIMSDVWDFVRTAVVADGDTFKSIYVGVVGNGAWAEVDAPEELLSSYKSYLKRQEELQNELEAARARSYSAARLARAREEAERLAALPKHGDEVVVAVDGRCRNPKVKAVNGKSGKVFWARDGRYGVALSDARDARGNFTNVVWCRETQIRKAG